MHETKDVGTDYRDDITKTTKRGQGLYSRAAARERPCYDDEEDADDVGKEDV